MKKKYRKIAILLVAALLTGCSSSKQGENPTDAPPDATGAVPTDAEISPTPTTEVQEETLADVPGQPENSEGEKTDAVYDTTAGNIYTEVTGDTAITIGVNLQEDTTLDIIRLGDEASEAAHQVSVNKPIRGEDIYGESYLQMSSSANYMSFEIAVDPKSYNYITVKLWGGDHGYNSALILYNKNNPDLREQDYSSEWPLLDYQNSEAEQDGTYYYATYRLPIAFTFNKTSVTIELRHYGDVDAYDLNHDGIKYQDTDKASRRIYQIASHTDTWYSRTGEETAGVRNTLNRDTYYPRSQKESAYDAIYNWLTESVETIVSWQLYGAEFEENAATGKIPEIARGALLKGGKANAVYSSMDNFASSYYNSTLGGNAENIKMMYGMALAYTLEGNAYYQNGELLERMCALWDFYVRAQGSNGGFGSSRANWIGISENSGNGYDSEGRQPADSGIAAGERSIAETFVMLYDALAETDLLDQQVDYDLDGVLEEGETRRDAYYHMFCKGADYGANYALRECVNQDLLNLTMMYQFQKAASLLGEAPLTDEYVMERLYTGLGIKPHIFTHTDGTQYNHGGWQFSKISGLSLETFGSGAGGYCGNYGLGGMSILYDFAYLTGDESLINQSLKASESLAYFMDEVMGSDGVVVLRKEEVINSRNTYMPGRISFAAGGNNFIPVVFGSEPAKKMLELYLQSGYWRLEITAPSLIHADSFRHLADLVTIDGLKEYLQAEPAETAENGVLYHYDTGTDYILPTDEAYGDFVWTDEMARCVVLRNGDDFLRMTLNWRMEYKGDRVYENAAVNNVLRVHGWNSNEVYTATAYMKSPFGFAGIYTARYGDYTIIMNASEDTAYEVTLVGSGRGATMDLVTEQEVAFDTVIKMEPLSSMVLYTHIGKQRTPMEQSAIVNPEKTQEEEAWDETELEEFTAGVYEIPAELDTYVKSTSVSENYSKDEYIIMGRDREGILLFDLRQVSEDVASIILRTYSHWGPGNELSFSIVEDYQSVTAAVTYLTGIEHGDEVARYRINSESIAEAIEDISKSLISEVDITDLVKNYRTEHPTATRLCLYITEPDVSNCTEIWSTENPHGVEYGPTLVITVE